MKYLLTLTLLTFLISCQTEVERPNVPEEQFFSNLEVSDLKLATTRSGETVFEFKVDNEMESYIVMGTNDNRVSNRSIDKAKFYKFQNGLLLESENEVWFYYVDKGIEQEDSEFLREFEVEANSIIHMQSVVGLVNVKEPFPIDFEFNKKYESVKSALYERGIRSKVSADCDNCLYGGPGATACASPAINGGSGGTTCQVGYYACCSLFDSDCCWVGTGSGTTGGGTTGGGTTGGGTTGGGTTGGGTTGGEVPGEGENCVITKVQFDPATGTLTITFTCL